MKMPQKREGVIRYCLSCTCDSSYQSLPPKKRPLLLIRGSEIMRSCTDAKGNKGIQLMLASCYHRGVCGQSIMVYQCLSQGREGMTLYL